MKCFSVRVCLLIAVLLAFSSLSQAQSATESGNFFQIRFFYPFATNFTSAITLDAVFKQQFDGFGVSFKLTDTNLIRQRFGLEVSGGFGYTSLEFTGGLGSEVGSRKNNLLLVGAFPIPKPLEGIQYLSDLTFVYYFETDTSAQSGYTVHSVDASFKGNLDTDWHWSAGYALSSVEVPIINRTNLSQTLKAEIQAKLDPLALTFGSSVRFQEGGPRYDLRFEGVLPLLETETLTAQATWNSSNGDSETLSLASTRFDPLGLSLSVSRNNNVFSLALNGDYKLDDQTSLAANYGISFGETPNHDFGAQFSYREKTWNARVQSSLNLNFDQNNQLWLGRFGIRIQGSYKVAPFNFSLRANLDLRPKAKTFEIEPSGGINASASYSSEPWTISADLGFVFNRGLSGTASTQILYRILPQLSLNLSGVYSRVLSPVFTEQFSFGLGIRYSL
jgi:hypothetical protein